MRCSCNNEDNSVENCFNKLGTLQNILLWSKITFKIKLLALCLQCPAKTLCFSFLDYIIPVGLSTRFKVANNAIGRCQSEI